LPGAKKGPGQVDGDVSVPSLLRQLGEWHGDEDPGYVREQIDRTEALLGRHNERADLILVADVDGLREAGCSARRDGGGALAERAGLQIGERHARPGRREGQRQCPADAAGGADYHGRPASKLPTARNLLSVTTAHRLPGVMARRLNTKNLKCVIKRSAD
jgi:hypothetical protein